MGILIQGMYILKLSQIMEYYQGLTMEDVEAI